MIRVQIPVYAYAHSCTHMYTNLNICSNLYTHTHAHNTHTHTPAYLYSILDVHIGRVRRTRLDLKMRFPIRSSGPSVHTGSPTNSNNTTPHRAKPTRPSPRTTMMTRKLETSSRTPVGRMCSGLLMSSSREPIRAIFSACACCMRTGGCTRTSASN